MATSKVILAVVVVAAIAFAQIEARPSTTDNNWTSVLEADLNETLENNSGISDVVKNATQQFNSMVEPKMTIVGFTRIEVPKKYEFDE